MIDEFIQHLSVERGLSPCTCTSYGYQLKGYLRFLGANSLTLPTVAREDILNYLETKKNANLAGSSIFAAAIAIRQFHRFLAERGHAPSDPTSGMGLPKFKQKLPEPLSIQAVGSLLDAPIGAKFHQIRNRAMLELMYATGMRVSELLGLTLPMLNLEECQARICGKGDKERIIPFGQKAKEAVLVYLTARAHRFPLDPATLFLTSKGQPINRGTFWWELKRMARRVGLQGRITPHQIRHSAATHMLEGGADIRVLQEFMGHSLITTTQRYAHVSARLLKMTCNKAHPRF